MKPSATAARLSATSWQAKTVHARSPVRTAIAEASWIASDARSRCRESTTHANSSSLRVTSIGTTRAVASDENSAAARLVERSHGRGIESHGRVPAGETPRRARTGSEPTRTSFRSRGSRRPRPRRDSRRRARRHPRTPPDSPRPVERFLAPPAILDDREYERARDRGPIECRNELGISRDLFRWLDRVGE